jgi:hypothetical protein
MITEKEVLQRAQRLHHCGAFNRESLPASFLSKIQASPFQ